ncbi:sigma-54 dependent transcriptional regulator [Gilvimarinus agarilyticus]|uniref:sigma-54-dependent transcriptional regulator n=1 Tax=unclassified Gilvimarinus TaxID=2642066 RepID=UPI001C0A2D75|nr:MULTISPECIES: sigma-54 dependent transcriptional regulator [unclassified Gilvimarinus]MBU2885205.1 sigma-54 dependent transcriptional regulator [Gilvimarinus agarilyticus]MDO6570102.1 sigma-54 dependent transcriptional regulator [Gilvimarinus sp. 2_MG-2023]MDO6748274.1 sigma-54 dependent transcriptional regulator [Gilvimarinus sp. 1_MG-2023]
MTHAKTALIVDDEPDIRELLEITLGRMHIETFSVECVSQAKRLLSEREFSICLTDMRLPDGNGLEIVEHIQQHQPKLPCAVITAHGNIDIAIESMKAGAFDFISKPVDLATLRNLVNTAIQTNQLEQKNTPPSSLLTGESHTMLQLNSRIEKLARSQAPVYISGESGAGKELVARSIHQQGPRHNAPFVAVNCGAIPKELLESELFGHAKGSFTGAHQDKLGLFQTAKGGTLFFDEVADLPLDMQVKLLRAIQEKSVRPVGASEEIKTNVRVLCATHKNLQEEVAQGNFRQDLFYRINVIQLKVPSLRQRTEDIPQLAEHLLNKISQGSIGPQPKLAKSAMTALCQYPFPGNVRELENILERAYTLCEETEIEVADLQLPENIQNINKTDTQTLSSTNTENSYYYLRCKEFDSLVEYLEEVEKEILCKTLEQCRWNKTQTAKCLGISFRSLRYRLQKLGLDQE